MTIGFADAADKHEVMSIWNYCFSDPKEYTEYYFKSIYKPENTVVARADGSVVSALQLNPYKISLGGKYYDTSYIVGVSTLPHYRGLGIVRRLFSFTFDKLYERGELVSVLMPIDYGIYRKFGYEAVCEQYMYELDMEMLSGFIAARRFNVARDKHEDFKLLERIYDDFTKDKNLFTLRDSSYYKNMHEELGLDKGGIVMTSQDSSCDGYMAYTIEGDSIVVREVAYSDIDALKSLLAYLYSHKTQTSKVVVHTFKEDYIHHLLPNIKSMKLSLKPFLMGRIINLKGLLESTQTDSPFASFTMDVRDDTITANSGCFRISRLDDGFVHAEKVHTDMCADLRIGIAELSQLAFGYVSPQELHFMKKITCRDKSKLDGLGSIFRLGKNYFNEYV